MKHTIILLSSLFILSSCKKDKETITNQPQKDTVQNFQDSTKIESIGTKIQVETFPFPSEIKECSCYFSKNKTDFKNEKYIYADDAGKTAYMLLDGKKLAINLLSSSDMEADDELIKEIENEDYKISIKGKKIKDEEALIFSGTMTIEKPDGSKTTMSIYGECGC